MRLVVFLALLLAAAAATAGGTLTGTSAGFQTTYTTGVYKYDAATGLPSVPQTFSTTATGGANSGTMTVNGGGTTPCSTASTCQPHATTSGKAPIPDSGGRSVPVESSAKIPKTGPGSAAKALGNFAFKVAYPLTVGKAIYDLAKDLNMFPTWNEDTDTNDWKKLTQTGIWRATTLPDIPENRATSALGACDIWKSKTGKTNISGYPGGVYTDSETQVRCYVSSFDGVTVTRQGFTNVETPITQQDFEDQIATMAGWPSNASRALVDALQAGETVSHDTPKVSGPASVAGPTSTKTEPATKKDANGNTINGTKTTTTTTTYNNTYNNNEVRITNNTTSTSVTNYSDGTSTTETSTESSEAPTKDEDAAPSPAVDKDLPELPVLWEPKYPNGPTGVFNAEMAKIKATPLFQLPSSFAPANLGDGGCPQWSMAINVGLFNAGSYDLSIPCYVWSFMRLVCIIGALFLARRLIFGG